MTQALYAHMNNKTIKKKVNLKLKKKKKKLLSLDLGKCTGLFPMIW
jgi:hypothetical protein